MAYLEFGVKVLRLFCVSENIGLGFGVRRWLAYILFLMYENYSKDDIFYISLMYWIFNMDGSWCFGYENYHWDNILERDPYFYMNSLQVLWYCDEQIFIFCNGEYIYLLSKSNMVLYLSWPLVKVK